jgi:hypothetical protein
LGTGILEYIQPAIELAKYKIPYWEKRRERGHNEEDLHEADDLVTESGEEASEYSYLLERIHKLLEQGSRS